MMGQQTGGQERLFYAFNIEATLELSIRNRKQSSKRKLLCCFLQAGHPSKTLLSKWRIKCRYHRLSKSPEII